LKRDGEKYYDENINKTILRDLSKLKVGDVWITDGHVLAFDIIDKFTGKPKRMIMIMYYDWASRMPVGISLATTENSEHIKLAFRNGCINAGYAPLIVYQDNGRAFRSVAKDKKEFEYNISGIYSRVGAQVTFAKPYNAKAKNIERFFKTFQEDFERFISSFRGSKIGDKPADLQRHEKWIKKNRERKPLLMEEAMRMIDFYVMNFYANTPHKGLNGKTPLEVWNSAQIDESRLINPEKLNYLMLSREIKRINNNGITFTKLLYYNPKLIKHVGQPCIIRYDFRNINLIKVYDKKNRFICDAYQRELIDPLVRFTDNQINKELLERDLKEISNNKKKAKKLAEKEALRIEEATNEIPVIDYDQKSTIYSDSLMIETPQREEKKSLDEFTSDLMHDDDSSEEFSLDIRKKISANDDEDDEIPDLGL
jgi:putative transposase